MSICAGAATRPLELGLMFTHRCPIECRHCGILSGPKNKISMDGDLAERCIEQAAELDPRPVTIVFTGGEPMMYPERLEQLLDQCNCLGFSTRVVTSGFWAKNKATGRSLLHRLRLAGLDALNFSADKYHLEFLEAWVLRQAIGIAWEVGFPVIVNMVVNQQGDPVELFSKLYGIDQELVRVFDENEFIEQLTTGTVPPEMLTKINLSFGRLVGLGRAAEYPEEHLKGPLEAFGYSPCLEVINRPVIYPDGSLQACCCAGGKINTFTVGNVKEHSLAELFEIMRSRTHFRFINKFGPRALYEAISDMDPQRRRITNRGHASICDICVAATNGMAPNRIDRLLDHWTLRRVLSSDLQVRDTS